MECADGDGERNIESVRKRNRALNFILLVCSALLLAALLTGAFVIADSYHVSILWVFAAWASVLFLVVVGWRYRSKFTSPAFAAFFLAWTLVHALLYAWVLSYLGFLYYIPLSSLELWIGYTVAIWLFGPPPHKRLR